ncbi:general transcription factor IIB (macronuclear) [Tetrahymena thermophila SB210]|uniref:General transcription factor IIB n=1 Tax=Tetrahymena thermophila (strain SB210) TaxID=312017 RepID=Q231M7_TETTS|nr:general transcription factor IIB [Tetrahymena thermophila SB210]EAR91275.3 general transcription factor IIB [Tetrahymena thermophila SB210]|eukprot:XP_001011520.3 general transcription factor IIB [Tetrahymena thermophila SB210]
MDYYQYQLLLQSQQQQKSQQQQLPQNQLNSISHLIGSHQIPLQQPQMQAAPSSNMFALHQQNLLQNQTNFKDNQFLGQPSVNDFNMIMQQKSQPFIANNDSTQHVQSFPNSSALPNSLNGCADISQQVFFQKAIQNQYINNIQQNREDIIRNYINIISSNKNRNPSNDNRNRNPSNENRNRNYSNENRNQNEILNALPSAQINNLLQQQNSSTAQNQYSAPQQLSAAIQNQKQQLLVQQQVQQQQPQQNNWIQNNTLSQSIPLQQQHRHSNHHMHHHHQQQQMNIGINMNELPVAMQNQANFDKKIALQTNFNLSDQQKMNSNINSDPLIDSFDQENNRLQQQITGLTSKLLQLNQSQAEILALNNYQGNKGIIEYLESQILLLTSQKKQILEQIESLQTLKLAYSNFRKVCPDGSAAQFMSLSKETQLLFLNLIPSSNNSLASAPVLQQAQIPMPKIEHTPVQLQFSTEAQNYLQEGQQQLSQDDQKSTSSKNSSSSNQKKNPFKVIRSNENSEDPDIGYISRKRETPVQSPSLSKAMNQVQDVENNKQQTSESNQKDAPQAAVSEKTIQESASTKPQQIQEDIVQKQNVQQIEADKKNDEQEEIEIRIDEEEDDEEREENTIDNENTTQAQTSTITLAQKLSAMNPAESKKFEKRREKLEENVIKILEKSEDACSKIKPIALELCSKIAVEGDVLKNRPYEAISAAVIVHASRLVANPITVKKMAKITESKEKIINRVFMYLKKNVEGFNNKMPQPEVFIKNICDKMKLSEPISKTAFFLHQQSDNLGLVKGQHAATVAACIVKLAACLNNMEMTVKQICEASNVCQISLRQLYRTIYPHRFELIGDHKINDIDFKKILNSPQMNLD